MRKKMVGDEFGECIVCRKIFMRTVKGGIVPRSKDGRMLWYMRRRVLCGDVKCKNTYSRMYTHIRTRLIREGRWVNGNDSGKNDDRRTDGDIEK